MNWGLKIVLGLAAFMTFIIVLAYFMMTSKNDDLVDADYYEKGINYDVDFQKKTRVNRDQATPEVVLSADQLTITFAKEASGSIKLIRTADKDLDRAMVLKTDSLKQFTIPTKGLARGLWKLQIDWDSHGTAYLYEKEVML